MAWKARDLAMLVEEYERLLPEGGWPNWVLGNHDQPRIAARVGGAQARAAAMLLLTLRGTPTMYYGDEIGLSKVEIPFEKIRDPWARNEPGLGLGRDPARTPMQWTPGAKADFTTGEPWLPLDGAHETRNVESLRADDSSIVTLYRRLIALRREHLALSIGSYASGKSLNDLFSFERRHGARLKVILNLSSEPKAARLPDDVPGGKILLSTWLDREGDVGPEFELRPDEGLIIKLESS
jgi:alpha-glucosidase